MSTFPRLFSGLCAALLCALTLAGCAPKDTVRLLYTPVTPSVLPARGQAGQAGNRNEIQGRGFFGRHLRAGMDQPLSG